MKKKIIILGSTGSVGKSTLSLIAKRKKEFKVEFLSTNKNVDELINQAKSFSVKNLLINDVESYNNAKKKYDSFFNIYNSFSCLSKILKHKEIYYTMVSVVGLSGLYPTLKIIKKSQNIAIANKEAIICGWPLIKKELEKFKTNFIPVDSEHFSIYSSIQQNKFNDIDEIFLTASGGPFLNLKKKNYKNITVKKALNHPNWKMGKKISVDSSTMMNKIFEVIEARNIFNLNYRNIKILIHPKSYVHSIVKFNGGLVKIVAHQPNMQIPIANSIYSNIKKRIFNNKLNLEILNNLNFTKPDQKKFPLIKIINFLPNNNSLYETALITINDFFVFKFLEKKITYVELVNFIYKFAKNQNFTRLKKKKPLKIDDIFKTHKYVSSKLLKLDI